MLLTILTWLWDQPGSKTKYNAGHVNAWRLMVKRHLSLPHEIACITDMPSGIHPSVRIIEPLEDFVGVELPTWGPGKPQCLRRLSMFRRDAAEWLKTERIVCMDLDCVICDSLNPVLDTKDDFKISRGTSSGRKYNGSLIGLKLGTRPQVFETFTRNKAVRAAMVHLGSDQAWLAATLPDEKVWTPEDGVRFWLPQRPVTSGRIVFFAGMNGKPWSVDDPLARKHYPATENLIDAQRHP